MSGFGKISYRWVILLIATLIQAGVSILQQSPAALGPVLIRDLDLSRAQIGILSAAIWGGMLFAMLPVGLMIDRHGERRLVMAGATATALLALWATQFNAFFWLLILFLLASIGAATSAPGGSKAIAAWFPHSQRGGAMGIRQTGVTLGGLLAAFLLPPVAVRFGWEVGLGVGAGIALFTIVLFALFYRELPADADAGSVDDTLPRVPVGSMLRDWRFLAATGYAFVLLGVQVSSTSYLALFLHEDAGFSVVAAGAFLAVFQVGGIAGRICLGIMSDRIGVRRPVLLIAALLATVSCLALAFVGENVSIFAAGVLALLLGSSAAGWNGVYLTLLSESVPINAAATAIGASLTIAFLGMFLASPLFGLLADVTGSYGPSWLCLAGWSVVGVLLGCLAKEPRVAGTQP